MSRFDGAFGLVSDSGHPATQPSNNPPCFRYSMKNGSWPSGVTAAPSPFSHSTWTRPANGSAITDRSLPYSTDGCSPAGCPAATARPVLMPLRLHGFADFANYQLPEIGSCLQGCGADLFVGRRGALRAAGVRVNTVHPGYMPP